MNKIFSLVVIISGLALQTSAQIATSSPYSRFGLGDLHENFFLNFQLLEELQLLSITVQL